ncbi:hypothetical protein EV1_009039 [Malus domestica]
MKHGVDWSRLQLPLLWLKLHMSLSTVIFTGMVIFVSMLYHSNTGIADLGICICCKGNILLSRSDSVTMQFTLEGKQMFIQTFGLVVSIIGSSLSRISTGNSGVRILGHKSTKRDNHFPELTVRETLDFTTRCQDAS